MAAPVCTHLDSVQLLDLPPTVAGCQDCLREGTQWCHLRICLTCGHVGCCDSSPGRHASRHAGADAHPIMRSLQPGEDWCWWDRALRAARDQGEVLDDRWVSAPLEILATLLDEDYVGAA